MLNIHTRFFCSTILAVIFIWKWLRFDIIRFCWKLKKNHRSFTKKQEKGVVNAVFTSGNRQVILNKYGDSKLFKSVSTISFASDCIILHCINYTISNNISSCIHFSILSIYISANLALLLIHLLILRQKQNSCRFILFKSICKINGMLTSNSGSWFDIFLHVR